MTVDLMFAPVQRLRDRLPERDNIPIVGNTSGTWRTMHWIRIVAIMRATKHHQDNGDCRKIRRSCTSRYVSACENAPAKRLRSRYHHSEDLNSWLQPLHRHPLCAKTAFKCAASLFRLQPATVAKENRGQFASTKIFAPSPQRRADIVKLQKNRTWCGCGVMEKCTFCVSA